MRKNPHGKILKREPKKHHLNTVLKSYSLANNMIAYTEKKIVRNFTLKKRMDEFYSMKNCH